MLLFTSIKKIIYLSKEVLKEVNIDKRQRKTIDMLDVFLGMPSPDITRQMMNNVSQRFWKDFMTNLEDFNNSQDKLPVVGSYIKIPYKVDPEGQPVDTDWQILGYNGSIPKYVKYKDASGNRVYVDIFPDTLPTAPLITDFTTAKAYADKDGTKFVGDVTNPLGTFTYGNNNTYIVPTSITVNGTSYTFAGYNATIMSRYGLVVKFEGNLYVRSQFRSYKKSKEYRNDWRTSEMREWLNGTEAIPTHGWYHQSGQSATIGTIVGLLGRFPDQNFMKNIIPTVNRTWVNSSWRTDQSVKVENYTDKFWLLGAGNINTNISYIKDYSYDTSKFTDIFIDNNSRIRKIMNEDGTEGSVCVWWVRSASDTVDDNVHSVYTYGNVNGYAATSCNAILPACLIG